LRLKVGQVKDLKAGDTVEIKEKKTGKIRRQEVLNKLASDILKPNEPGKAGYNEKGMKSNNQ